MNPDLMSHQTNYEYVPFRENTRYQKIYAAGRKSHSGRKNGNN